MNVATQTNEGIQVANALFLTEGEFKTFRMMNKAIYKSAQLYIEFCTPLLEAVLSPTARKFNILR